MGMSLDLHPSIFYALPPRPRDAVPIGPAASALLTNPCPYVSCVSLSLSSFLVHLLSPSPNPLLCSKT